MTEKTYRILMDTVFDKVKEDHPYDRVHPDDYEREIEEFFRFLYADFQKRRYSND